MCCLYKQDCSHYVEDNEVETSMFDKLQEKQLPELVVENLDETVGDREPSFPPSSLHNQYFH